MDIKGTNEKLWVNHHQRDDGSTWDDYSVSASSKNQDGSYTYAKIELRFAKSVPLPGKIHNGSRISFEGFMSARSYRNRNGEEVKIPVIIVTKAAIENNEPRQAPQPAYDDVAENFGFEQADEEIPF